MALNMTIKIERREQKLSRWEFVKSCENKQNVFIRAKRESRQKVGWGLNVFSGDSLKSL